MKPKTENVPKCLISAGGQPFMYHQIKLLAGAGVTEFVYCIGHLGEQVREYGGDGCQWGVRLDYIDEGEVLRGTGGALRLALDAGLLKETFLMVYGDSYTPVPVQCILEAIELRGSPALMCVMRNEGRWDRSNCIYEHGRPLIYDKTRTHPRAEEMRYIDYGLSVFQRDTIGNYVPPGQRVDLADVFQSLSRGGRLQGFVVAQRFYEIGSPTGLAEFEQFLSQAEGVGA
jgi:NDP-sugar pyrophosphorylase family protein